MGHVKRRRRARRADVRAARRRAGERLWAWAFVVATVGTLVGLLWVSTRGSAASGERVVAHAGHAPVTGDGRTDASHVLPASTVSGRRAGKAYRVAARIPATLNRLYCWCGCIEGGMRSLLECFESRHAVACEPCLGGAELAWTMTRRGVTAPARIQRAIDIRYGTG